MPYFVFLSSFQPGQITGFVRLGMQQGHVSIDRAALSDRAERSDFPTWAEPTKGPEDGSKEGCMIGARGDEKIPNQSACLFSCPAQTTFLWSSLLIGARIACQLDFQIWEKRCHLLYQTA